MTNAELRELSRKLDIFNMEYFSCPGFGSCSTCKHSEQCSAITATLEAIRITLKKQELK